MVRALKPLSSEALGPLSPEALGPRTVGPGGWVRPRFPGRWGGAPNCSGNPGVKTLVETLVKTLVETPVTKCFFLLRGGEFKGENLGGNPDEQKFWRAEFKVNKQ